jgi:hypothetical protein
MLRAGAEPRQFPVKLHPIAPTTAAVAFETTATVALFVQSAIGGKPARATPRIPCDLYGDIMASHNQRRARSRPNRLLRKPRASAA